MSYSGEMIVKLNYHRKKMTHWINWRNILIITLLASYFNLMSLRLESRMIWETLNPHLLILEECLIESKITGC